MQVIFESPDPQAAQLRTLATRRVRQTLKRLAWLAPSVRVSISDVSGLHGGVDKRCQVEVTSSMAGQVVIASTARDWRSALQSALARVVRTLLQKWQRGRAPGSAALQLA